MRQTEAFGENPGALRMFSHVPEGLAPGAPIVVVLHGCTQKAEAFAQAGGWVALADRHGFAVIAPDQRRGNNLNRCFNWFEPGDVTRGQGEAASIHAMVVHLAAEGLAADRVFVAGLSAGGAMASALLATYPEMFEGGAIVAGVAYGLAHNLGEALGAMRGSGAAWTDAQLAAVVSAAAPGAGRWPRVAIWHGDADKTVAPDNAAVIARQWAAVQGLDAAPGEVEALAGRTRSIWRDGAGRARIELNLMPRFGHGQALSTLGPQGVGAPAPFMLEAGISTAQEILRFWGLAGGEAVSAPPASVRKRGWLTRLLGR